MKQGIYFPEEALGGKNALSVCITNTMSFNRKIVECIEVDSLAVINAMLEPEDDWPDLPNVMW